MSQLYQSNTIPITLFIWTKGQNTFHLGALTALGDLEDTQGTRLLKEFGPSRHLSTQDIQALINSTLKVR